MGRTKRGSTAPGASAGQPSKGFAGNATGWCAALLAAALGVAACGGNDDRSFAPTPTPTPAATTTPGLTPTPVPTPTPTATPAFARCADPGDLGCCGNGIREGEESCDDLDGDDGDGCRADCTIAACPPGLVDPNAGCAAIDGGACVDLPESCGPSDLSCTIDAEELHRVVRFLADDAQGGRNNDTDGSRRAQDFLVRELRTFAFPGAADGSFRQPIAFGGTNLLARLPGSDPSSREVVVVGAHYDHLGPTFNGATDNAAGVSAVLAVGRALARLPKPLRRTVILALWDAEEDGLVGAFDYAVNPVVPLADTIAYVNFDIVGSAPVRGFRRNTVLVGLDTSPDFPELVERITMGDALDVAPLSNLFGQGRSDHEVFVGRGVPVLFFSDATGGCYHTTGDDEEIVHYGKILRSAWMAIRFVQELADGVGRPRFTAPALPLYSDAVSLRDILKRSSCELVESGLSPQEAARIEGAIATLDAIVARGEEAFGGDDPVTIAQTALAMVDLLAGLPCQRN